MLEAILIFFKITFLISLLSLITGLFKPVYVLWFLDRMNRLKVIKVYGSICLILLFLIFGFSLF
ncbi:MAG: hypothetical protein P8O16_12565 [Algoriphagus sp.]|uniref:hypothetical protein n=1 Tax=Algoriphagus sp. TaxID=1872435 RepID=UPI00262C1024|nr:hypothetical protein [Algoriphagus sp.]MDG1278107.1 hypothetical protein [Algoriphagus sp.]